MGQRRLIVGSGDTTGWRVQVRRRPALIQQGWRGGPEKGETLPVVSSGTRRLVAAAGRRPEESGQGVRRTTARDTTTIEAVETFHVAFSAKS